MRKPKPSVTKNVEPDFVAESTPPISAKERYQMIAEAAYFRAEKRGFTGGSIRAAYLGTHEAASTIRHGQIQDKSKNGGYVGSPADCQCLDRNQRIV